MSIPAVFPDAELVVTTLLRAALPAEYTVGTEWPEDLAAHLPTVAVTRSGGAIVQRGVTEDVTLDIDILAAAKKQAHDVAQQVRALLYGAEGSVQPGARLYGVRDISLIWLPYQPGENTDSIPRYVLVMQARIRPA
ncbi:hypothetical protein AB0B15_14430 [Streptomyces sp. NPDC045456]|uniref:hypothetical protein n=1 Tax=Streptomyces sp. NPDC045456 TaxID=3155254 RepID=UPI0033CF07B2